MSEHAFDTLMASVDTPLVVVTTVAEGEQAGCLVGFHAQSSIAGEHYCLWLSKANHTYRTSLCSTHFAVHFLTQDDLEMARRFGTETGERTDKFAGLDIESDEHGVPLVKDLPNRILLDRLTTLDDGGDHVCVTSRVRQAQTAGRFTPLRLSDADHLEPGHAADERAVSP